MKPEKIYLYLGNNNIMTIVINKNSTKKQVESARQKALKNKPKKQGLARSFGALKRNIDGLKYQKEVRNEWN